MASIKGIEAKNIKSWEAREGIGTECSIYLKGKKIGKYLDEGRGGEGEFQFDSQEKEKAFEQIVIDYYQSNYQEFLDTKPKKLEGYALTSTKTMFMSILVDLADLEKLFKKEMKKGIGILELQFAGTSTHIPHSKHYPLPLGITEHQLQELTQKKEAKRFKAYRSLQDFIVS